MLSANHPWTRFIKEGADAASKALPKVEKEKLETEKAAPSKVSFEDVYIGLFVCLAVDDHLINCA